MLAKPKPTYRDEQYAPDTLRNFIDELERVGSIDEPFSEPMSMDWRAERSSLPHWTDEFKKQKSWIPHVGELVLFVRALDGGEICRDEEKQEYKVFDLNTHAFVGHPKWECGVVTQVAAERLALDDLLTEGKKAGSVVYSGFRVEPLPDPNGADKSLSKKHKYIPLHHTRPMVFWEEFLRGISEQDWHPTIRNGLKVFSSLSLVEKHRFKGTWPNATVSCQGIYLGPEFIAVGDAVRLLPGSNDVNVSEVTDVLHVTNVKFRLSNLDKASDNDDDEGHPYNSSVFLVGKGYSLDASRSFNNEPVLSRSEARSLGLPKGMNGYDYWYRLHEPTKFIQVPFSRVLGRCYEAEPMLLWFPSLNAGDSNQMQYPSLSQGLHSVLQARTFSTNNDSRIPEAKEWYWGDTRSDCLGIAEFNGLLVSAYDPERDEERLTTWADYVRALERMRTNDRTSTPGTGSASTGALGAGPMAPPRIAQTTFTSSSKGSDTNSPQYEKAPGAMSDVELEAEQRDDNSIQQLHSELKASENSSGSLPDVDMTDSEGSNEQHISLADRFGLSSSYKSKPEPSNEQQLKSLTARFGLGLSYQSARPEASARHQHQSLTDRLGLEKSRKRSRSVASLDADAEPQDELSRQDGLEHGLEDGEEVENQGSDENDENYDSPKRVARDGEGSMRDESPSKRARF